YVTCVCSGGVLLAGPKVIMQVNSHGSGERAPAASRHAAIGSDLDGGFGTEQSPREIDTIADLQKIPPLLAQNGFKPEDIEAVMHANRLRFFEAAWAKRP